MQHFKTAVQNCLNISREILSAKTPTKILPAFTVKPMGEGTKNPIGSLTQENLGQPMKCVVMGLRHTPASQLFRGGVHNNTFGASLTAGRSGEEH